MQEKKIIDNKLRATVDMKLEHNLNVFAKILFDLKVYENVLTH